MLIIAGAIYVSKQREVSLGGDEPPAAPGGADERPVATA